ncbi:hypothetical protein HK102_004303 [Quaeritorhiza haematococci]|nr:hypothetical protein HK102_004303 [Quaeritorhiza haematococci]
MGLETAHSPPPSPPAFSSSSSHDDSSEVSDTESLSAVFGLENVEEGNMDSTEDEGEEDADTEDMSDEEEALDGIDDFLEWGRRFAADHASETANHHGQSSAGRFDDEMGAADEEEDEKEGEDAEEDYGFHRISPNGEDIDDREREYYESGAYERQRALEQKWVSLTFQHTDP